LRTLQMDARGLQPLEQAAVLIDRKGPAGQTTMCSPDSDDPFIPAPVCWRRAKVRFTCPNRQESSTGSTMLARLFGFVFYCMRRNRYSSEKSIGSPHG
jgi:hypothetical protein